MQDYLIVKGHLDLIENANVHTGIKPGECNRKDRVGRATIRLHLSELVYYTIQSCATAHAIWAMLLSTYEKKMAMTKIYLIGCLYNL